uniref:Uncharacterized protein n=1 Tax=Arundo donax TaxID=35708 RepID=A0A0A8Z8N2_ARUDO
MFSHIICSYKYICNGNHFGLCEPNYRVFLGEYSRGSPYRGMIYYISN